MNDEWRVGACSDLAGSITRRGLLGAVAGAGLFLDEAAAGRRQQGRKRQRERRKAAGTEAAHGDVLIETWRGEIPEGEFEASGAIDDSGTFSFERVHFAGIGAPTFFIVPTLEVFMGKNGAFSLQNHVTFTLVDPPPGADPDTVVFTIAGAWSVFKSTGGYKRLHGHGTIAGSATVTPDGEEVLEDFTGTMFFA